MVFFVCLSLVSSTCKAQRQKDSVHKSKLLKVSLNVQGNGVGMEERVVVVGVGGGGGGAKSQRQHS